MKPFLLVSTRPEDEAIESEYRSFLAATGLGEEQLEQVRIDMLGLPDVDVTAYSGILIGGSSYGTTTRDEQKTQTQKMVDSELERLFGEILRAHTPCFSSGYGTEVATVYMGGKVSRKWAEDPQIVDILLTTGSWDDPIFEGMTHEFTTFVRHSEAVEVAPEGAVVLAKSLSCPIQMMRLTPSFYATQFNPELDSPEIERTLQRYSDAGYPGTDDPEELLHIGRTGYGDHPAAQLLKNFVKIFASAA
ncbi:glutamine amidotransferase [Schaalia sp. ZJ405]|uniref:glutamine amidotransferase-related protein n=1 Tax=unclassified Schaalia TaxID=2691889 RepID=UPI0013EE2BF6|nr:MULTISPECIES: glutamine amidotransferase [unclassified Schaalia]QPK81476.1 glutamine amidotransferase [Schaalia sp. ZJ405]